MPYENVVNQFIEITSRITFFYIPKKLRPSNWRSLEGAGGVAVVFVAAVDVETWLVVFGGVTVVVGTVVGAVVGVV